MRLSLIIAVLAQVACASASTAQHLDSLRVGSRVRVDVFSSGGSLFGRDAGQRLTGRFAGLRGDTILLSLTDSRPQLPIPLMVVRRAYVSDRRQAPLIAALRGAVFPAILGAAEGSLAPVSDGRANGRARAIERSALAGAVLGGVVSLFTRGERWRQLALPVRRRPE